MTIQDLILIDKHKVRRDSNLMHLYIQFFKQTFNYLPTCTGCSFNSDWNKLRNFYLQKNQLTHKPISMSNNIKIKKVQGKILTYHKDGKTYRLYDNILNDDFIKEYVANGTPEELAQRKKMFDFPVKEKPVSIDLVQEQTPEPLKQKRGRKAKQ